ncbi:MAG: hypothetical protein ACOC1D_04175 [Prolixibacteraceae bacterium]
MKYSFVLILVFTLFTLISCSPAKQDSKQTQEAPDLPQNQEQSIPVNVEPDEPVAEETAEQPSTDQNNAEVMLNPAHGEPHHRCDIPVGAPLDSPPASTTRKTTTDQVPAATPQSPNTTRDITNNPTAPTIENARRINPSQTPKAAPANNGNKPRMNPPHGQPYHRCDIAVGSPLP